MSDYVVIVTLSSEAIALEAESVQEAKDKALSIMIEEYGESIANDATYEVESEGECDKCTNSYEISSRDNRCGDCGNCSTCCTHKGEGK